MGREVQTATLDWKMHLVIIVKTLIFIKHRGIVYLITFNVAMCIIICKNEQKS